MILFSTLLFACSDEEEPAAEPAEEVVDTAPAEEAEDTSADSGEPAE
jgi:hypothetical protein